jgi:hypothetical protein
MEGSDEVVNRIASSLLADTIEQGPLREEPVEVPSHKG